MRRVLIVDDHRQSHQWLDTLISQKDDLQIVGEAASAREAKRQIAALKPDIVLVDVSVEDASAIRLIKQIKASHAEVSVVVLSVNEEPAFVEQTLDAGARGFVTKRKVSKNLLPAIRSVLDGKLYLSEEMDRRLAERLVERLFIKLGGGRVKKGKGRKPRLDI